MSLVTSATQGPPGGRLARGVRAALVICLAGAGAAEAVHAQAAPETQPRPRARVDGGALTGGPTVRLPRLP